MLVKVSFSNEHASVQMINESIQQASTLTQNVTGPVGPVTPTIYWSCNFFIGPTNFSLT